MTYQTSAPIHDLRMNISARSLGELIRWLRVGDATYDQPYQRGPVWTVEQRILLIFSLLSGTPVPALIVNERPHNMWFDAEGKQLPIYAVIDGKQRLMSIRMFVEDDLAVPASWFPADRVEATEDTDDGPYVRWSGLSLPQRRFFERLALPVAVGRLTSVKAEAEVYLRVNGSGTPQSDEDLARAARVAAE